MTQSSERAGASVVGACDSVGHSGHAAGQAGRVRCGPLLGPPCMAASSSLLLYCTVNYSNLVERATGVARPSR